VSTRLSVARRNFLRDLVTLSISLAACWSRRTANAQESHPSRRIGILFMAFSPDSNEMAEFRRAMREAGYTEGRDIEIEWRSAKGSYDLLPSLAAELVQRRVDVLVVDGTPGALAAKRATSTIPIVMTIVDDPVGSSLVTTLAHPGGNVTGLSTMSAEVWAKRLQLLKETVPGLTRVAFLSNPRVQWYPRAVDSIRIAASAFSIQLIPVPIQSADQIAPAFSAVSKARAQALYVLADALLVVERTALLKQIARARLPGIFSERRFAEEGGLMSYGPNWADTWRRAAGYVDKILKGAKPGDLPIEQPTKLEFVVNIRTATAIGLTVPESVLLQADEVIR
jgi:putative ABC transport system substrate-binding protein